MFKVYSFQDVDLIINDPSCGQLNISGSGEEKGAGNISIASSNDVTVHDVAADGHVMVSKIIVKNGTIGIEVQQTSEAQEWLERWSNYVCAKSTPSNQFAQATIHLKMATTGEQIAAIGVSPQKLPDKSFQSQGQRVTWNLMATDITYEAGGNNV